MDKVTLGSKDFVHLHNHTQYSLLDGLTKIPALVERVSEMGMNSVAITDHGTLSGAIEFYKEATSAGIKPIIGIETYVATRAHTDKDPAKDKQNYHLSVLAMDNTGYKNLMRLSTIANLDGFYYRPRIDHELLEKYNQGLIVLSGCMGGELSDALRNNQHQKAKEIASWYKSVFGDRYFIEIQDHGHQDHPSAWDEQIRVTKEAFKLAKELGIECVLTCDAHYLRHEDQEAHEILLCVQTGSFLSDENRMSLKNFELHLTDPKQIIKRWGNSHPEIITNSRKIGDRCEVNIELGKILIPKFFVPKGETEKSHLEKLVYRGLAWRYGNIKETQLNKFKLAEAKKHIPSPVLARARYEFGVIDSMGFNGYFLIIADFINWGKNKGIVFGPGRGSAAGSIIAYALNITELDPLKYDLLFERFLNPDRISMPDIDVDIQDSRRDEVIQYCIDKYGENRVANIVTFGRMAARNAVRDVARVLQVPYAEADRLAKMIPHPVQGRHIPLATSIEDNNDLKHEYESNDATKRVFDLAVRLEGTIRSHGVHAAGVVIAPEDIVHFTPLEMAQKGVVATQYSMGPIEDLGLLKMDFLGLSNLTIIKNALRIIKKVYGEDININTISLNDEKTYQLLQRGDTTGVFQFESSGMKRYLKDLKPTVFDDIIAMGALYRPGPLTAGLTQKFIDRKNGREPITYEHPSMKPALESTYGVLVYQEQVMRIAQDMCGFSGGEADTLRKAIGKKKRDVMAKMKEQFIAGGIKKSKVDRNFLEKFWKSLEGFADYAFNKSHSACYGLISFQTAYLKAHYPSAFMAALMTSDFDDTDRLAIEITECQHMGIEVLPPDVNESFVEFAVVSKEKHEASTDRIRFGMAAIKNVGTGAVEEILRARASDNSFANLEDFFGKVNSKTVNRKTIESLIKAGAFDSLADRAVLKESIDQLLAYSNRVQKQANSGQTDLFAKGSELEHHSRPQLLLEKEVKPILPTQKMQWERELLGLYLSQNPLQAYKLLLDEQTVPINIINPEHHNKTVAAGGAIEDVREITTKNGQKMIFVKIVDGNGEIEIVVFPSVYQQTLGIWERDNVVIVKGKVSSKDKQGLQTGEIKILADEARLVTNEQAEAYQSTGKKVRIPKPAKVPLKVTKPVNENTPKRIYLRLMDSKDSDLLIAIKQVIASEPGETEVILVLGEDDNKQIIKLPITCNDNPESIRKLQELLGEDNVVLG